MIRRLQEKVEDYENYIQTGNGYLDIILRDKMRLAKESEIDVQAEVDFSEGKFIDGLDISTIFGNAWDNAIEACTKLPKEQRFITVKAGVRNRFVIVKSRHTIAWIWEEKYTESSRKVSGQLSMGLYRRDLFVIDPHTYDKKSKSLV